MPHAPQIRIPATYMRGGTSKGVFFRLADLPAAAQSPGAARDRLLMRVIGSPDPYGKQIDGMGGATSSTSKTVILSKSSRPDHDIDYLFGQVSIDAAFVDWSGNCGNLSAAVGPFSIANGLVDPARIPANGVAVVRIWQMNIGKTIIAHVPITNGQVQETGDFELDGVTFPAAEVQLEFMDPAAEEEGAGGAMFPTGLKPSIVPGGPAYLREYLSACGRVPHLAIGGITPANVGELAAAGCQGVAVSSVVCGSQDPASVVRALVAALGAAPSGAAVPPLPAGRA